MRGREGSDHEDTGSKESQGWEVVQASTVRLE